MPTWPGSLPQRFPINTIESHQDARIRSQMDASSAKVRRRFTSVVKTYTLPPAKFILSGAQKATLEIFFDTTLSGGVLTFTWGEPWPNAGVKTFRIVSPLEFDPIVGGSPEIRKLRFPLVLEEIP